MSSLDVYYKVVYATKNGLTSAIINNSIYNDSRILKLSTIYGIHYRTQRWVNPKLHNSKIFIFKDYYAAHHFMFEENSAYDYRLRIYTCLVKNPQPIEKISSPFDMEKFWDEKYNHYIYKKYAPSYSYVCDSIFLMKRVY